MDNLKLVKDLKQEASYLQASCHGTTTASNLMNQAAEEIENLRKAYGDPYSNISLKKKCEELQQRNDTQAEMIRGCQTGKETTRLLIQIDLLFNDVDELKQERDKFKKIAGDTINEAVKTEMKLRIATVENQRLANLQKELQREQMISAGSLITIGILRTKLKKIKKERDRLFKLCENNDNTAYKKGKADACESYNKHIKYQTDNYNQLFSAWGELKEINKRQAACIKEYQDEVQKLTIRILTIEKERNEFAKEINELIIKNYEFAERNDNQAETINHYRTLSDKLQAELDKHTKYEGGVTMKCGHPVQCAYACSRNDKDDGCTGCSMCDLQREVAKLQEKLEAIRRIS